MSTTIRISRETKKNLQELGRKGQTFDDLVRAGTVELENKEQFHVWNVPMFNGDTQQESYIEVRVPKSVRKLAVDEEGLVSALRYIMEEHGIEEIEDPRTGVVF